MCMHPAKLRAFSIYAQTYSLYRGHEQTKRNEQSVLMHAVYVAIIPENI